MEQIRINRIRQILWNEKRDKSGFIFSSHKTWRLTENMWEKRKNTGTLFSDLETTRKMHSEAKSCKIDFSVGLCLVTTQKTR